MLQKLLVFKNYKIPQLGQLCFLNLFEEFET